MAHDELDSTSQDPNSRNALVEKEKPSSAESKSGSLDQSPDNEARPVDSFPNDSHNNDDKSRNDRAFSPSSSALRVPGNLNTEEGESNTQRFGFKPRTIPGKYGHSRICRLSLGEPFLANTRVCTYSMDSIN